MEFIKEMVTLVAIVAIALVSMWVINHMPALLDKFVLGHIL